jgi:hypothetical protein
MIRDQAAAKTRLAALAPEVLCGYCSASGPLAEVAHLIRSFAGRTGAVECFFQIGEIEAPHKTSRNRMPFEDCAIAIERRRVFTQLRPIAAPQS